MTPAAREVLAIYWDGEETAGFTVYGLRPRGNGHVPNLPSPHSVWDAEVRSSTLHGERWEVCVWDVRLRAWPEAIDFDETIRQVLCTLIERGFLVAWIGLEGRFADPPLLFTPEAMSGGVIAACSERTGFLSVLNLDQPLRTLPDSDLAALREVSVELAAAW